MRGGRGDLVRYRPLAVLHPTGIAEALILASVANSSTGSSLLFEILLSLLPLLEGSVFLEGLSRLVKGFSVPCMIVEQIRRRLENGFHPFSLHLSSGREFLVPHRDFIAVHPKAVVVIDAEGISHTISPLHIVSIDEAAQDR